MRTSQTPPIAYLQLHAWPSNPDPPPRVAGILYKDDWDDVWDQDKSETSFYQLCAAERQKMIDCCADPSQSFLGGKCPNDATGTEATGYGDDDDDDSNLALKKAACEAAHPADTWDPEVHDFAFFKSQCQLKPSSHQLHTHSYTTPSILTLQA